MGHEGHEVKPIIQAVWKGKRVRAVWDRICFRPLEETFHEFILNVLRWTCGKAWYSKEIARNLEDRHQIVNWFLAFSAWRKGISKDENRTASGFGGTPDGPTKALISLAYDVYSLQHTNHLPKKIVRRLKDRHHFQGARYEIAIAAIFARAGFGIRFQDDKSQKHCEFVASRSDLPCLIAVEAKSRHRPGVLHQPGTVDVQASARADVEHLIRDAEQQAPEGMPYMVFIDLNSPPVAAVPGADKRWFDDLVRQMAFLRNATPDHPDPWNAVFLTNFAYHYGDSGADCPPGGFLLAPSAHPRWQLPDPDLILQVWNGLSDYGRVPPGP